MPRFMSVKRCRSDRQGAAAVEFALVLPFLMTIFVGILKFGIAMNNKLVLTEAVRIATRQFAVSRSTGTAYTATNTLFTSAAPSLPGRALTMKVNGAACGDDTTCNTAIGTTPGATATLVATANCDLVVLSVNFAPGCKLTAQMSERIE